MSQNIKFYKCPICGNVIEIVEGNIENIKCCGQNMQKIEANTTDAATEKHVPIYERVEDEIVVKIGEVEHPMEKEHYINWIMQVKDNVINKVILYPEQSTQTRLPYIKGSTIYAYCNKHGLWKNEVE